MENNYDLVDKERANEILRQVGEHEMNLANGRESNIEVRPSEYMAAYEVKYGGRD